VAPCQLLFYGLLAGKQPIHRLVDLVLVHTAEPQFMSQAAGLAFLLERLGRGELAAWAQYAGRDERKDDAAFPGMLAVNQPVELQIAERAKGGGDMAVRHPSGEGEVLLEGFCDIIDDDAAFEEVADLVTDGFG